MRVRLLRSRLAIGVVGVVLGATIAGAASYALGQTAATDVYYACATSKAAIRPATIKLNVTPACRSTETLVSWNAQGPQGMPGSDADAASIARLGVPGSVGVKCPPESPPWGFSGPVRSSCGAPPPDASAFALPLDRSDYPANATIRFTGALGAQAAPPGAAPMEVCIQLYDSVLDASVSGTEACLSDSADDAYAYSTNSFDLGPLDLPSGDHRYAVQYRIDQTPFTGATGGIYNAVLVVDW